MRALFVGFLIAGFGLAWMGCSGSSQDGLFNSGAGGSTGGNGTSLQTGGTSSSAETTGTGPSGTGGAGGESGSSGASGQTATGGAGQGGSATAGKSGSSGASLVDGGGGTLDGAAGAPADVVVVDAGSAKSIACGTETCTGNQFCCLANMDRCVAEGGPCPPSADRLYCDDRTDCGTGEVCCLVENGGVATATCTTTCPIAQHNTQILCKLNQIGTCAGAPGNSVCATEGAILN